MTEGKTTVAPGVLESIARLTTLNVPGVSRLYPISLGVNRLFKSSDKAGIHVEIKEDSVYTDIFVVLESDVNVRDVSRTIQQEVSRAITEMIGMRVGKVNVHIEDIDYPNEKEA